MSEAAAEAPPPGPHETTKQAEGGAAAPASEGRAKRERKQVERLTVEAKKEDEFLVPKGSGTQLRDIPNVAFKLGKISGKDELMEGLHYALYRRKGTATTRKKTVLEFCGFAFAAEEKERELDARKASLGKWKLELIHRLMDALDMTRGSGDKATKVNALVEFLEAPKALSNVDLAAKEVAKKEKEKAQRARAAAKKDKAKAAGTTKATKRKAAPAKPTPKKKAKKDVEADEDDDEGDDAEGSASEEEVMPTKTSRRRGESAADDKQEEADAACSQVPTDQLRADIEAILSAMSQDELASLTSKPVVKALEAKHGFSFKPRKAEVADMARDVLNAMPGVDAEPQEQHQDEPMPDAAPVAAEDAAVDEAAAEPRANAADMGEAAAGTADDGHEEAEADAAVVGAEAAPVAQ